MRLVYLRHLFAAVAALLFCGSAHGQTLNPDFPLEDFSSASIASSKLQPDQPMVVEKDQEPSYVSEWIQVIWRVGDPIYLYVIRPAGVKNPPVVMYLYDYPAETDIFNDDEWCARVTSGGVAAVGFVPALNGHRYHDRPMQEWFVSELQEALAKSSHDVQMALNYLATRGDLDMNRVGIYGVGAGATIAAMAASVDSRIKAIDLVDPWGDWPAWLAHSSVVPDVERAQYLKPDFLNRVAAFDPVKVLPKLARKRVRLSQFTRGAAVPLEAQKKIAAAAPAGTVRVNLASPAQVEEMAQSGGTSGRWMKSQLKGSASQNARTTGKPQANASLQSAPATRSRKESSAN